MRCSETCCRPNVKMIAAPVAIAPYPAGAIRLAPLTPSSTINFIVGHVAGNLLPAKLLPHLPPYWRMRCAGNTAQTGGTGSVLMKSEFVT